MKGIVGEPEGATPIAPDELEGIKFPHITTRGELDELEQVNIEKAMLWLGRSRKNKVLAEAFIRKLHRQMFGEVWRWAGTFRLSETNVGIDPQHIAVQLQHLIDDALYWTENSTYEPIEAAARFHRRLVQIHCFPNGNGRHARIMTDIFLETCLGHAPLDWAGGYDLTTDNSRRDVYLAALRMADGGNIEALLEFMR